MKLGQTLNKAIQSATSNTDDTPDRAEKDKGDGRIKGKVIFKAVGKNNRLKKVSKIVETKLGEQLTVDKYKYKHGDIKSKTIIRPVNEGKYSVPAHIVVKNRRN